MFAATISCPDIAHAINKLAQYSNNPTQAHCNLAKQILQYIYHTRDQALALGGDKLSLYAYSDADFAGNSEDRRSMGGYAIFLGTGTVAWSSKKQSIIALSSTESEYIALLEVTREILWTCRLLQDFNLIFHDPTTIYEDNQGTIAFATNQKAI